MTTPAMPVPSAAPTAPAGVPGSTSAAVPATAPAVPSQPAPAPAAPFSALPTNPGLGAPPTAGVGPDGIDWRPVAVLRGTLTLLHPSLNTTQLQLNGSWYAVGQSHVTSPWFMKSQEIHVGAWPAEWHKVPTTGKPALEVKCMTSHFHVRKPPHYTEMEKVAERTVVLKFGGDRAHGAELMPGVPDSRLVAVQATGRNKFGRFQTRGTWDPVSSELTMGKMYLLPTKKGLGRAGTTMRVGVDVDPGTPPILRLCAQITDEIIEADKDQFMSCFTYPVDPKKLNLPTYFDVVKKPMALKNVADNLAKNKYTNASQWIEDMELVYQNAMLFNPEGNPVHEAAKKALAQLDIHIAYIRELQANMVAGQSFAMAENTAAEAYGKEKRRIRREIADEKARERAASHVKEPVRKHKPKAPKPKPSPAAGMYSAVSGVYGMPDPVIAAPGYGVPDDSSEVSPSSAGVKRARPASTTPGSTKKAKGALGGDLQEMLSRAASDPTLASQVIATLQSVQGEGSSLEALASSIAAAHGGGAASTPRAAPRKPKSPFETLLDKIEKAPLLEEPLQPQQEQELQMNATRMPPEQQQLFMQALTIWQVPLASDSTIDLRIIDARKQRRMQAFVNDCLGLPWPLKPPRARKASTTPKRTTPKPKSRTTKTKKANVAESKAAAAMLPPPEAPPQSSAAPPVMPIASSPDAEPADGRAALAALQMSEFGGPVASSAAPSTTTAAAPAPVPAPAPAPMPEPAGLDLDDFFESSWGDNDLPAAQAPVPAPAPVPVPAPAPAPIPAPVAPAPAPPAVPVPVAGHGLPPPVDDFDFDDLLGDDDDEQAAAEERAAEAARKQREADAEDKARKKAEAKADREREHESALAAIAQAQQAKADEEQRIAMERDAAVNESHGPASSAAAFGMPLDDMGDGSEEEEFNLE